MHVMTKPGAIAKMEAKNQPYSTCVQRGREFYFSGVVATNKDGHPDGDFEAQTIKVLDRIEELLTACKLRYKDVYSVTVMLAGDMSDYALFNKLWLDRFGDCPIMPRRKVFAMVDLPFGCAVEIEFDAVNQS